MSLSMMLLEMLHWNQIYNRRSMNCAGDESAYSNSTNENLREKISIKKKNNGESMCRVCLKEGSIQIFGNKTAEDLAKSFNVFAGIEIRIDDPYPKYLCQACYSLLQGAILFRKTAQQTDEILKLPPKNLLPADNDETFDVPVDDNNSSEYEPIDKNKKIYHCKKCELSFDTFKEYDDHRQTEEHQNKKIVCPVCNIPYTELEMKKHLALHKDDPQTKEKPSYMCDICGKQISGERDFTRHRVTHFYQLPIKCSLCPYKGRFSESLKIHMRSHTGERPYPCAKCPKRFISKSNLNRHILTHKKECDFKCETCGKGYYTKRELELHYKVDHTGIKEHVCNICGKAFGYRKQMMKHQLKVHKRAKLKSGRMPLYLQVETMKQQGQTVDS